jgi:uncharacterized protein YuzE
MTDTRITCDQDADAIYIRFSDTDVASTIALSNTVYIDVDQDGNPIGMEVLRVDSSIFAALKDVPDTATLRDLIRNAA